MTWLLLKGTVWKGRGRTEHYRWVSKTWDGSQRKALNSSCGQGGKQRWRYPFLFHAPKASAPPGGCSTTAPDTYTAIPFSIVFSFFIHSCSSLVTSNSLGPHGLQPARLLHPWGFPGMYTGMNCHFLPPGHLSDPGIKPRSPASSALARGFFTTELLGKRFLHAVTSKMGFPGGSAGKESACLQCGRPGFHPWVGKIPCRRARPPTPVFWPGEFHGLHGLPL